MVFRLTTAILISLFLSGAGAWAAEAPSFDCSKANEPVEHLICENTGLAMLDAAMGSAFRNAMITPGIDHTILVAWQRDWLMDRRDCFLDMEGKPNGPEGHAKRCLFQKYRRRVKDLDKLTRNPELAPPDQGPCIELQNELKARALTGSQWHEMMLTNLFKPGDDGATQFTQLSGEIVEDAELGAVLAKEGLKNASSEEPDRYEPIESVNAMKLYQTPLTEHQVSDLAIEMRGGTMSCGRFEFFFRDSAGKLHHGMSYQDNCVANGEYELLVNHHAKTYLLSVSGAASRATFKFFAFAPSGISTRVCRIQPFLAKSAK